MKVKCIDDKTIEEFITRGKIYLVETVTKDSYKIIDDTDERHYYSKCRFIPVEEDIMKVKCINDENYERYLTKDKIYRLVRESEDWYYIVDNNNNLKSYLKYRFEKVSESEIVTIAKEIAELVEKKDKDYNSAFSKTLKEYGNVAYFLRIDDKLNRLKNLMVNNTKAEVNESVEDTLKDIIGYTLLMLKEIK